MDDCTESFSRKLWARWPSGEGRRTSASSRPCSGQLAIDLGYAVKVLSDAVCSGADETQDATLQLLGDRFPVQVEVLTTEEFLRGL